MESAPGAGRQLDVKRLTALALYALFLLLLVEVAARLYWKVGHGTPFFRMSRIVYTFYPELAFADGGRIRRGDRDFDILLLGGSVLNNHYGNVGHLLAERLTRLTRRPVRVHNLARRSHTSLDSFYKYGHLEGQEFDLVVFYHGINETRANNCPPEVYRTDYSHYSWYESVNSFHSHWEVGWLVFPFTFDYAWRNAREKWGLADHVTRGAPRPEWVEHGRDVKTAESFHQNLDALMRLVAERGERALLMSFAYYIPADYSEEAFRALALDYSLHAFPVELWGAPAHVAAALEAQNAIVEKIAAASPHAVFVDQNRLVPKTGEHFNDVCHLTGRGCETFVDNILGVALEAMRQPP